MTILTLFGLLTLFLSTSVIFDLFGIRAMEGNYVLFVVWANFISSIIYLLSVYGLLSLQKWVPLVLLVSTVVLIIAYVGLKMHINAGGLYEEKTVGAMVFRSSLTIVFTILSYIIVKKQK
ncbi:MAG TPA: hypothetical protein EYG85_04445 [Crocinitomix sp.]|nr:hypothetical protein [Crocinitomix sp.]